MELSEWSEFAELKTYNQPPATINLWLMSEWPANNSTSFTNSIQQKRKVNFLFYFIPLIHLWIDWDEIKKDIITVILANLKAEMNKLEIIDGMLMESMIESLEWTAEDELAAGKQTINSLFFSSEWEEKWNWWIWLQLAAQENEWMKTIDECEWNQLAEWFHFSRRTNQTSRNTKTSVFDGGSRCLNDESNLSLLSLIGGLWTGGPANGSAKRREREEERLIDSWKQSQSKVAQFVFADSN